MAKERRRSARSIEAERRTKEMLLAEGHTPAWTEWLGVLDQHHVVCSNGHDCYPRPNNILRGRGPCKQCGLQRGGSKRTLVAEQRARDKLIEDGHTPAWTEWLGVLVKHHVICSAGHDCYTTPHSILNGCGPCGVCGNKRRAISRTQATEKRTKEKLSEEGYTPMWVVWKGSHDLHAVRCSQGHDCYTRPNNFLTGYLPCRKCAGNDPATSERKTKEILVAAGHTPMWVRWEGSGTPHHVRCRAGHDCYVRPDSILRGGGPCARCKGKVWDVFYVVSNDEIVKPGISSGTGFPRLNDHRRNDLTETIRHLTDIRDARKLEQSVLKTLRLAGWKPVKGREYFPIAALPVILDVVDNWK